MLESQGRDAAQEPYQQENLHTQRYCHALELMHIIIVHRGRDAEWLHECAE